MKTQELNQQEQENTNGGSSILGGDDNMFKAVTQDYINQSSTDDNGDTNSNHLDFGSGSLLQNMSE